MRAPIDEAVEFAWAVANYEACQSGSPEIDPEHFVVSLLKLLDDDTIESLPKLDLRASVAASIRGFRKQMSHVLGSDSRAIAQYRDGR